MYEQSEDTTSLIVRLKKILNANLGGDYLNNFPSSDEEINLLKFISMYQYLDIKDTHYFFSTQKYYKKRISNLIAKKYLKKFNFHYLILDKLGIEFASLFNFQYNKLNRNQKYLPRLLYISKLAAFYNKSNTVKFIPSFSMKDKQEFTTTSRKFIGIFEISGIEYLTYYLTNEHTDKYLRLVIYDLQKEKQYKNIIILTNDENRIKSNLFVFGFNQVLVVKDTEENREKLKYLHSINWYNIIKEQYKRSNIYLSDYSFCEYTDYKNKYINTFYFFDTEKVNRINYFLEENKDKNVDIVCNSQLKERLIKELPNCNYCIIDLEQYIDKEPFYYD